MSQQLAAKGANLSSIHGVMCGAAPLLAELVDVLAKCMPGACMSQGYCVTETTTTVRWPPHEPRIGTLRSAGRLIVGWMVRVLRMDRTYVGYIERSELIVKGPSITLRYLNNETV